MNDFIQITKDDVIPRIMNGEDVYAFGFNISSKGYVTQFAKKLNGETVGIIANIVNGENVVLYAKTK